MKRFRCSLDYEGKINPKIIYATDGILAAEQYPQVYSFEKPKILSLDLIKEIYVKDLQNDSIILCEAEKRWTYKYVARRID